MPLYRHILVIINPKAGPRRIANIRETVEDHLKREGVLFTLRETGQAGDALRWARSAHAEGYDLIAVAGGDGTIREAVEGVARSGGRVPIAQIPTGSANVTARALSIPTGLRRALNVIFTGKTKAFDIGYLPERDRYFVFVAGAGYDAQLIRDTTREQKKVLGFFAYVATGSKHFFRVRPKQIELEVDNEIYHLRAHTVMAVNIGTIASLGFSFGPNIDPHDGSLNIMIMSTRTAWASLRVLFKILTKRYYGFADLKHLQAKTIRVTSNPPIPVQIDGEPMGETPFLAEVIPGAVQFVVPIDYE